MKEETISKIEKIIGYEFNDKTLLCRAFTHSSKTSIATKNYQSLEFLGDAIVDFIVAKHLMEIKPDAHEGELTILRSQIVSKEPLSRVIEELGLNSYLIVENGSDPNEIQSKPKIMSDIFEAITAAIYLDSKSIDLAEKFVLIKLSSIFNELNIVRSEENYKSALKEYCDKHRLIVSYEVVEKDGPAHDPTFKVVCKIGEDKLGEGVGHSKKDAEQEAAKAVLDYINK